MAQGDDLAPYRAAKVNWRQAEGQEITVAVIPASYFENLISLQPQFEALTGESAHQFDSVAIFACIAAAIGILWLGEPVRLARIAAVALAFMGVLLLRLA